jgi:hypothetical protein
MLLLTESTHCLKTAVNNREKKPWRGRFQEMKTVTDVVIASKDVFIALPFSDVTKLASYEN